MARVAAARPRRPKSQTEVANLNVYMTRELRDRIHRVAEARMVKDSRAAVWLMTQALDWWERTRPDEGLLPPSERVAS